MIIAEQHKPVLPVAPRAKRAARADGLHLSQIIKDLCLTLDPGRFEAKDEIEDLDEVPIIWLGCAYEDRLQALLPYQEQASEVSLGGHRPAEIQYCGIYMNADRVVWEARRPPIEPLSYAAAGVSILGLPPIVEEHKLTKMSGAHAGDLDHPKFRHWLWQLMFYCAAFETSRGRIRGFFVNSDYRFDKTDPQLPQAWQYRVWDLWFQPGELTDNTQMVLGHARQRGWL